MKTLIQKELRENFKLAVIGTIVLTLLLLAAFRSYTSLLTNTDLTFSGGAYRDRLQPLLSEAFLIPTGWFCAIFGAVIGFLQIHNERHRDLWAFLVHRPVTRTQIFLSKVTAGAALYSVAAGLPLLVFVLYARMPGHVAAPFEWAMALPACGFFLSGMAFYFAGMLVSLRQARWYASRGFGLGVALLVCGAAIGIPAWHFWQTLLIAFCGAGVLAAAGWGAFQSGGYFEGQPALGKGATVVSLLGGAVLVILAAAFLFGQLLPNQMTTWSHYIMTKDGVIYKQRQTGRNTEIINLDDTLLKDPKTGRPVEYRDFYRKVAGMNSILVYVRKPSRSAFFNFLGATPDTLWYYSTHSKRLLACDRLTRRFVASVGPNGFSQNADAINDRFTVANHGNSVTPPRTWATATEVYDVDLDKRTTRKVFSTTADDPIEGIHDVMPSIENWDYTIVATRRFVHVLTQDGQLAWKQPYRPIGRRYTQIQVSVLEPAGTFALWIGPGGVARPGQILPTEVTWIDKAQGVLKRVELPTLGWSSRDPGLTEQVLSALMPPLGVAVVGLQDDTPLNEFWRLLVFAFVAAVICVTVGWRLGRRYNFSRGAQLRWALFHLAFGVPGLLTFLSVQEWPSREACRHCKKLRVVDREDCEYCGTEFAAPGKVGIEIFEPLAGCAPVRTGSE